MIHAQFLLENNDGGSNDSLVQPSSTQAIEAESADYEQSQKVPNNKNGQPLQEKSSFQSILDQQLHSYGLKYKKRYSKRRDTLRTILEKLLAYCFLRLNLGEKQWQKSKGILQGKLQALKQSAKKLQQASKLQKNEWNKHILALEQISEYSIEGMIEVFASHNPQTSFTIKHFTPYITKMKQRKAQSQLQQFHMQSLMIQIGDPSTPLVQRQMIEIGYPAIPEQVLFIRLAE